MPLTKFHVELTGRILRGYTANTPPENNSKLLPQNISTRAPTSEASGSCKIGKAINNEHSSTNSHLDVRADRVEKDPEMVNQKTWQSNIRYVHAVGARPISFVRPIMQFGYEVELLSKKTSTCLLQNIRTLAHPCKPIRCGGSSNEGSGRSSGGKALTMDNINPNIVALQYAVRGPLVIRAAEIEQELLKGAQKPFKTVIRANIGDAHAMGQKPVTFIRQVLACMVSPSLIQCSNFPEDVKARASDLLQNCGGKSAGAYTASYGIDLIRKNIAAYIAKRDGYPSKWENICLCGGASSGIRSVMQLFSNSEKTGVMIPIPQYPLYSATIAEYGLEAVRYYLNEQHTWALELNELQRSYDEGSSKCKVRAIVVINPGNPTGQVLSLDNIETIVKFAHEKGLFILADEVYQHNVYAKGCQFHSFKKVINDLGDPYNKLEMASFMSASKCYMGECGIRGGWMELTNMDPGVQANLYKALSARLCPSSLGQVVMDCVVRHPVSGDPSYELFEKERLHILESLAQRAKMVYETFNKMEGFTCNIVQGAMYAFPQIKLPPKAIEAAEQKKQKPDVYYAFRLLEETGICIIPGTGFGQKPGTWHFRTTILPQPDLLKLMLDTFQSFHIKFTKEYS
ncbi:unnamed protein product [Arctia plantaginis]|uniref:alanine transaminase n=1 Tax=Arctia plantaginis TaxID=874455 RepID=A0A8S0YRX0_ARCPL|nr:unnamed protein product [Arctia plantaginis]